MTDEKTLTVLGKRIVVKRSTTLAAIRLARLREQMKLAYQDAENDLIIGAVELYPKLIACSECLDGELPTVEEYLNASDVETNIWLDAVAEINPHWFEYAEPEPEKLKKKYHRRHSK